MEKSLTDQERERRKQLCEQARAMIAHALPVETMDEICMTLAYDGFYLQVAFSECHPLLVIYLARAVNCSGTRKGKKLINELNLCGVLGSYALNDDVGCYSYRATLWLDAELTQGRFLEILGRCADEANRGYQLLSQKRAS